MLSDSLLEVLLHQSNFFLQICDLLLRALFLLFERQVGDVGVVFTQSLNLRCDCLEALIELLYLRSQNQLLLRELLVSGFVVPDLVLQALVPAIVHLRREVLVWVRLGTELLLFQRCQLLLLVSDVFLYLLDAGLHVEQVGGVVSGVELAVQAFECKELLVFDLRVLGNLLIQCARLRQTERVFVALLLGRNVLVDLPVQAVVHDFEFLEQLLVFLLKLQILQVTVVHGFLKNGLQLRRHLRGLRLAGGMRRLHH